MQNGLRPSDSAKRIRSFLYLWLLTALVFLQPCFLQAAETQAQTPPKSETSANPPADEEDDYEDEYENAAGKTEIWDPLQKINRKIFDFNDKMYFRVMEPVARGYSKILPSSVRICLKNFFNNLKTPVPLINNLLQGKFKASLRTLGRFSINTTFGFFGFFDPAKKNFHLEAEDEDLGQTLGYYGIGHGFYVVIPFLGPSSLRDGLCLWGDGYLNPIDYLDDLEQYSVHALRYLNVLSLNPGNYETLKKAALDPYDSFKNVYLQYREEKIKK